MRWQWVVLLVLVFAIAGPAVAQDRAVSFSFKGGLNFADIDVEPVPFDNISPWMRYGGGVGVGFQAHRNLSFDLDVLYMVKGQMSEVHDTDSSGQLIWDFKNEMPLEYLVISPMLRIAPMGPGPGVYALAGAEIGVLLSSNFTREWTYPEDETDVDMSMDNFLTDTNVAISLGAGFQVGGKQGAGLFFEGRYVIGLTDIYEAGLLPGSQYPDMGWKTRDIYVFAGVRM